MSCYKNGNLSTTNTAFLKTQLPAHDAQCYLLQLYQYRALFSQPRAIDTAMPLDYPF